MHIYGPQHSNPITPGTMVNDLVGLFGGKGAVTGAFIDSLLGNEAGKLANLRDAFFETAFNDATGPITRNVREMFMGAFPMAGMMMMGPMAYMGMMGPALHHGYAGSWGAGQEFDLRDMFDGSKRQAKVFEKKLKNDSSARARFEQAIGGTIVDFGSRDGVVKVQRYAPGMNPAMLGANVNPLAMSALGMFAGMNHAVMGQAAMMSMGPMAMYGAGSMFMNPFMGMTMSGFHNIMAGMNPYTGDVGPAGPGWGYLDNSGPWGGRGVGSWNPLAQPGRISNTNPMYEVGHQMQVGQILADPSLTVEDKVTLLIMIIMNKMDDDIMRQAQYINSIQNQQAERQAMQKWAQGQGMEYTPWGQDNSTPSIDVETMKLKRLIDKRSQMFDILRQIIDKYNQTAKGIIDSIGR
jgi:hypothetical protein